MSPATRDQELQFTARQSSADFDNDSHFRHPMPQEDNHSHLFQPGFSTGHAQNLPTMQSGALQGSSVRSHSMLDSSSRMADINYNNSLSSLFCRYTNDIPFGEQTLRSHQSTGPSARTFSSGPANTYLGTFSGPSNGFQSMNAPPLGHDLNEADSLFDNVFRTAFVSQPFGDFLNGTQDLSFAPEAPTPDLSAYHEVAIPENAYMQSANVLSEEWDTPGLPVNLGPYPNDFGSMLNTPFPSQVQTADQYTIGDEHYHFATSPTYTSSAPSSPSPNNAYTRSATLRDFRPASSESGEDVPVGSAKNNSYNLRSRKKHKPATDALAALDAPKEPWTDSAPSAVRAKISRNQQTGLYFSDWDSAKRAFARPEWGPPKDDDTIPKTNTERRAWARKLVAAIDDTTRIPIAEEKWWVKTQLDQMAKEKVMWDILALVHDFHVNGDTLQNHDLKQKMYFDRTLSFAQRMNAIIDVLSTSKRACLDTLKGDKWSRLVAAPSNYNKRQKVNVRCNDRKKEVYVLGKAANEKTKAISQPSSGTPKGKRTRAQATEGQDSKRRKAL